MKLTCTAFVIDDDGVKTTKGVAALCGHEGGEGAVSMQMKCPLHLETISADLWRSYLLGCAADRLVVLEQQYVGRALRIGDDAFEDGEEEEVEEADIVVEGQLRMVSKNTIMNDENACKNLFIKWGFEIDGMNVWASSKREYSIHNATMCVIKTLIDRNVEIGGGLHSGVEPLPMDKYRSMTENLYELAKCSSKQSSRSSGIILDILGAIAMSTLTWVLCCRPDNTCTIGFSHINWNADHMTVQFARCMLICVA